MRYALGMIFGFPKIWAPNFEIPNGLRVGIQKQPRSVGLHGEPLFSGANPTIVIPTFFWPFFQTYSNWFLVLSKLVC